VKLWRVFPWDPSALAGQRFSASFIPGPSGRGRFDLPAQLSPALYLAETPEHALAELLHPWRGQMIDRPHLTRGGHRLAKVEIQVGRGAGRIVDLSDPGMLTTLAIGPDQVASRLRSVTHPIARAVWDRGAPGLRWWSQFWGDWHTVVLFPKQKGRGGSGPRLEFGQPELLELSAPVVVEASRALGIQIADSRPVLPPT